MTRLEETLARILTTVDSHTTAGVAVVGACASTAWTPRAVAEEPAYLAYSITKTFTATLLLLLQEEQRLRLDDRLARWFPRIAGADRITLRQLLNHTAGIPDYGGLHAYHDAVRASPSSPWSFDRFAAETFDRGVAFEPGTDWAYSNPGYMLLKRIIEDVAGATYAVVIADRIARPLGLARTTVPDTIADLASLAPAPSRLLAVDGTSRDVRDHYHPGWVSHGVMASTPSDVARFFDALANGRVVAAESLREMTTFVRVPSKLVEPHRRWRRPSYGLGVMGDRESSWGIVWGHNGGGPGYRASAFHAPDLGGVSVCVMAASEDGFDTEQIVFAVLDVLAQA
jgi:D-alanyl-D-alanine carboxypeptidase